MAIGIQLHADFVFPRWELWNVIPGSIEARDFFAINREVSMAFGGQAALVDALGCKGEVADGSLEIPAAYGVGFDAEF